MLRQIKYKRVFAALMAFILTVSGMLSYFTVFAEENQNQEVPEDHESVSEKTDETQKILTDQYGSFLVTVSYNDASGIPDDSRLAIMPLHVESELYQDVKDAVVQYKAEQTESFSEPLMGLAALDITIYGPDGEEVEPSGDIQVSISIQTETETIDQDMVGRSLEVQHLDVSEEELQVDPVVTRDEDAGTVIVDDEQIEVNFEVASLSVFTITWEDDTRVNVHFVDREGNPILNIPPHVVEEEIGSLIHLDDYQGNVSTYDYLEARRGDINGEVITDILIEEKEEKIADYPYKVQTLKLTNAENIQEVSTKEEDIYFIYDATEFPYAKDIKTAADENAVPTTTKTLTDNLDGTYTLTLSVSGTTKVTSTSTKANVVVCFDSSNSMEDQVVVNTYEENENGTYGHYENTYSKLYLRTMTGLTTSGYSGTVYYKDGDDYIIYTGTRYRSTLGRYYTNTTGPYGRVNNQYVQLYQANYGEISTYDPSKTHYIKDSQGNYDEYNGPRYIVTSSETTTRLVAAQRAVKNLANHLLAQNKPEVPDLVEMAFINYGSIVRSTSQKTTSAETFSGYVDAVRITNDSYGGTNWEAGLVAANNYRWNDDDPVYVVFVTDGNPTFRLSRNGVYSDGSRTIGGTTVYGSGNSDTYGANLSAAQTQARAIMNNGKGLYTIGVFGDADKARSLGGTYFEANDPEAMEASFDNIVNSITNRIGYANVQIDDGITSLSADMMLDGAAEGFYYNVTDSKGRNITSTIPDLPEATFQNGVVSWNLGEAPIISGATYSVSFVVWPSQEAYQMVSDLNNGLIQYDDLTEEQKGQFVPNGMGGYSLKTNTFCTVSYQTVTQTIDELTGEVVSEYSEPKTAEVEYDIDPLPLDKTDIAFKKNWIDSLDESQLNDLLLESYLEGTELYHVTLHVYEDYVSPTDKGKECQTSTNQNGFTFSPDVVFAENDDGSVYVESVTWPVQSLSITPGIMISQDRAEEYGIESAVDEFGNPRYKEAVYGTDKYYIIEPGHDYVIKEDNTDYHFEFHVPVYHPMFVNGHMKNVIFVPGTNNTVIETITPDGDLTAFDANNELKGGINVKKNTKDKNGEVFEDKNNVFTIRGSILDKDGNPYTRSSSTVTAADNQEGIVYRIYHSDGSRTAKIGLLDSSDFVIQIKGDEVIRFINIPSESTYSFTEINIPDIYYLESVTDNAGGHVSTNKAHDVEIINHAKPFIIEFEKIAEEDNSIKLEGINFELYDENNDRVMENGSPRVIPSTDANGMATIGTLEPGIYYLRELNAPEGHENIVVKLNVTDAGVEYSYLGVTHFAEGKYHEQDIVCTLVLEDPEHTEHIFIAPYFDLPMTGSQSMVIWSISCVLSLLFAGLFLYSVYMKYKGKQ